MKTDIKTNELFKSLVKKGALKQTVYKNTVAALDLLKKQMAELSQHYFDLDSDDSRKIPFIFKDRGEFEAELRFAGDTLVFMMHSNVFEFSRNHTVMNTPYILEDKDRSYCGVINIFNFLNDSFKYQRLNDVGYLIGRIFINKDNHYFIEGKREIGFIYSNFGTSEVNEDNLREIVIQAISYTLNFDLLVPPYDSIKEVTVGEFMSAVNSMQIKTGKRLGFKFQADMD
ncbi:MAG: hypothetical protein ACNA7V_02090 [Bacteroidales bacterium]